MSPLPENVIRLDDRRPSPPEPDPPAAALGRPRHLRLVDSSATAAVFDLDTFLARARIVMAETPQPGGGMIVPLHAQPA
jgi:hypothetical protein